MRIRVALAGAAACLRWPAAAPAHARPSEPRSRSVVGDFDGDGDEEKRAAADGVAV